MRKWFVLVCSLLLFGTVEADIRVLFRFAASGHFVHRVIQVARPYAVSAERKSLAENSNPNSNARSVSPIDRARSWRNAEVSEARRKQKGTVDGFATLTWFDASGVEMTQTEVPDPRIVHSPSHVDGVNASRNAISEGAWLVSGPDSASSVRVSLPESTILGLAAQSWNLPLIH